MPLSLIELNDIKHTYKLGNVNVDVLKGINMSIEQGEFVSIMGPSGSGKSTLLNIIGCLDKPSSGSYEIDGQHIEKLNDNQLADIRNQFLGFVFQSFHLLPELDAISNVELPLIYRGMSTGERRKKAEKALEAVGLGERLHHRPTQMSGGEQQRVATARAFVGEPSVILADEPTGALDSQSGQNIMAIFQKLNTELGITIVQVTHEEEIANHGTRIFHLKDGEIEREVVNEQPLSALIEEV
jgi:putative ABC transport system ATP-binding protein